MSTIPLREHDTASRLALTPHQAELLRNRFDCHVALADTSGEHYNVRTRERVGAIADGGTTIVVRPKLPIARVLFLLARAADPHWDGDAALAEAASLTEGVVMLFAASCDQVMRNGVLRGYCPRDDRLHTVRGRIDFAEQLRITPGRHLPLAVLYEEHDVDIIENRLLLAAVEAVAVLPVLSESTHRSLRRLRHSLAGVTRERYDSRSLPAVRWTALNQHYRPSVELARLILEGVEADLNGGAVRTPGFVINMNSVFENFVRNATRHALGLTEQAFPGGGGARLALDDARRLLVEPDLSYWIDNRCRFVGELKYRFDSGTGEAQNLYQTLAYATAAGVRDATLIYADGPLGGSVHHLPTAGVRIHVRHLKLDLPPAGLLDQIRVLAEHISALAGGP